MNRKPWTELPVDTELGAPSSREDLIEFIRFRMRIPIEPTDPDNLHLVKGKFDAHWRTLIVANEVDRESDLLDEDLEDPVDSLALQLLADDDVKELRVVALRVASWYPTVRAQFLESTKLFRVPMATTGEYAKHFPPAGCRTKADLIEASSARSVAYLYYGITAEHLTWILDSVHEGSFKQLIGAASFSVVVDCMCPIGVSGGQETQLLVVKLNEDIAHAYPVVEAEARHSCLMRLDDDSLQGCASVTRA